MKTVAVVGAGNMGSGIAQKAAQEGFDVLLRDVNEAAIERGRQTIKTVLNEAVSRRILTQERADAVWGRVHPAPRAEDLAAADVVIEAVFEDERVKGQVFAELDRVCRPDALFATNTSSMLVSKLARATARPERFVGLHFFYHPAKNRLLEVIPGERTAPEAVERAELLSKLLGKVAIVCKDRPGFVVNRFFVPWLNEAVRLMEEGAGTIPAIERAAKEAFGIGMGPFELMNVTGVPIAYHAASVLASELGPFYAPAARLKIQMEAKTPWGLDGDTPAGTVAPAIRERLLAVVFGIACQLVEEGVCSAEDVDRGAKIGLRWSKGPFELMNEAGVGEAHRMVGALAKRHPSATVPALLTEQTAHGASPWRLRLVDLVVRDGVARIILNRPELLNAINEALLKDLDEAVTAANADSRVSGIVLEGAGKAFGAGGDVGEFVRLIKAGRISELVRFTAFGHGVLKKLDDSPKRVVVKLHGPAIGGGAELALTGDVLIASDRAQIGFPETGLGIFPGLGGTQRLPRWIGKPLARYLICSGEILDAKKAWEAGLVAVVAPTADVDRDALRLAQDPAAFDAARRARRTQDVPWVQSLVSLFGDDMVDQVIAGRVQNERWPKEWVEQIVKKLSRKGPFALRTALRLIHDGSALELDRGLALELEALTPVFSTKDALEGLSALLEKRRPTFTGA